MTISSIDESQRKAARVVGFSYLFAMAVGVFAEFYVRAHLIVYDNVAETNRNVMAHERLFRLSIGSDLIMIVTDVVLLTALYVVLKPVNRNLALLAAFWRLVENSTLVAMTLNSLDALRVLSGADYLRVFEADRLQALARLSIGAHDTGYMVGMIFFGLGSTVFSYLWFKSRYIPRALAALGVFGSLLVAAWTFTYVIFPHFANMLAPAIYVPIFVFEVTMGFWLLLKGLRSSGIAEPARHRAQAGAA